MKQLIKIPNRSIAQLINEEGIIEALVRLKCNENLSFISEDYKIGDGTKVYHFANIFGKGSIGKNCIVASYVEIQDSVVVGNNCRVGSFSFLCSGVTLEDNIFLGSHTCFINDRNPVVHNKNYKQEKTVIKNGASIGSGTVLMCGVIIGENAVIGAGSLVLKDIPSGEVWAGSPARFIKKI